MYRGLLLGLACWVCWSGLADEPRRAASGNAIIRGKFGTSDIVITTTERLAGAIHSLKWSGKEFIDSQDHGRQLQSAASFESAHPASSGPSRFNPTEAGSRADGRGDKSSSKLLLNRAAEGPELRTTTQMAFWLAPGEKSSGRPGAQRHGVVGTSGFEAASASDTRSWPTSSNMRSRSLSRRASGTPMPSLRR